VKLRHSVLVVALSVCLVCVFVRLSGETRAEEDAAPVHSPSWSEMREIRLQSRDLEDEAELVRLFRERLAELKAGLKAGANLEAAARELVAEAHDKNPRFLIGLNKRFPHMSELPAAAANLVEDIAWQGKRGMLSDSQRARVDDLWRDLERIPGVDAEALCQLVNDLPQQSVASRKPSRPSPVSRPGLRWKTAVASFCINADGRR
jgi:hypothetical protein